MKNSSKKTEQRQRRHIRSRNKISGTKQRPRLVVFRSLKNIYAQLVNDDEGKTIVSAHDMKMKKGNKIEKANEVGKKLAEEAGKAGVKKCIFDRNGYKYHGRIKSLAEGAREKGLKF